MKRARIEPGGDLFSPRGPRSRRKRRFHDRTGKADRPSRPEGDDPPEDPLPPLGPPLERPADLRARRHSGEGGIRAPPPREKDRRTARGTTPGHPRGMQRLRLHGPEAGEAGQAGKMPGLPGGIDLSAAFRHRRKAFIGGASPSGASLSPPSGWLSSRSSRNMRRSRTTPASDRPAGEPSRPRRAFALPPRS